MLPLRPHLNWGGTSCPGKRWPEWVPWLRHVGATAGNDLEDDMTNEQLKAILEAIAVHDANEQGRRDQIIKAIADAPTVGGLKRGDTVKLA